MSGKLNLLEDSSGEEESNSELTINKNYASRYDVFRNREELRKLKELSKDVSDTSESEEEIEPKIEKGFLKALSLLKGKDPTIYDENFSLFKEEEPVERRPKARKEKPMFMKDYERKVILECNGELSEEEGEEAPKGPNYYEELEEIKKSFHVQDSDDDSEGDLLKEGTKTKEQLAEEEEDYKKWLESEPDMHHLHKSWKDPNISKEDKFLRDYLLNKEFLVNDETGGMAACAQLTGDMDANILQDEEDLDEQAEFELKYQHRFEEPDEEFIKQYPRTVGDSLRRVDNKRKVKRQERAERKAREKAQKEEQLKRLKALKRKEIEEKFIKLKEVSGQEVLNFDEEDIESDFDPDKHDRKMKELFDDDYYANAEEQKPEFPYDEELDEENWDGWTREQTENTAKDGMEEDCNDEMKEDCNDDEMKEDCNEAEMDESEKLDWKAQFEADVIESTAGKKRKRRKSLFTEIVARAKPVYDPDGKSFEEYLDEYYRLDYEDVIGDQPVRFRYRKVVPNDFGLSIDEILAANDKELNKWCSVKKAYQYRQDDEEMYEVQAFKKKAQNQRLKEMTLMSVYSKPEETKEANGIDKKSKKKWKKKKKNFNRSAA